METSKRKPTINILNYHHYGSKPEELPPRSIYIGRGSIFGNPFPINDTRTREQAINKYIEYFYRRVDNPNDEEFHSALNEIINYLEVNKDSLNFVCFCDVRGQDDSHIHCHGQVIRNYINSKRK